MAKNTIFIVALISFFLIVSNNSAHSQYYIGVAPFKSGEKLEYTMSYGWIKGGLASLHLKKIIYNGKEIYYVSAIGKTIGLAHKIYHVVDKYESWFDPLTGQPYKSIMSLKESNYRSYNEVYFNHNNNTIWSSKSGKHKVKPNVFDIVSAYYHLRRSLHKLKNNQIITIHTFFHDEPWDLIVQFKGYETINTKLGKIECMKFNPMVEEGTFKDKNGLVIWISNDKNRIPVRVKMKFFVGSFKTELTSYSGLAHKLEFKD